MILHVTTARYLQAYKIHVEFNDGSNGEIDLAGSLTGSMFAPLTDKRVFAKFHVDEELGTIVWENGADLAPEYLKELLKPASCKTATSSQKAVKPHSGTKHTSFRAGRKFASSSHH
jgi:hypothetical protein